jgi:hypothetical protein
MLADVSISLRKNTAFNWLVIQPIARYKLASLGHSMTKGGFFMEQRLRLQMILGMVCCILLLNGCGRPVTDEKMDSKPKANTYAKDGLLGTTDANPNIPTNPTYHTYTLDASLVKDALKKINGIQSSTVLFRGPNIFINLNLDNRIDLETAMQIKRAARDAVSQMMPRYNVKVSVGKNKLPSRG